MKTAGSAALFLMLLLVSPLSAQEDEAGCKDHPLFTRMPGFYIDSCENAEFDAHEFAAGEDKTVTVEGKKTQIRYIVKEGGRKVSALQLLRNYMAAVQKAGGRIVWSDDHLARGTARLTAGGAETWVAIHTFDQGEGCDLVVVDKQAMAQEITAAEMLDALNRDGRIALSI